MHGCGWDSGAARQRSSALAASVASRYALGADGVGAAHPGARGSRVTASRYALGAEGGGAARPGAYMCSPRNCARCLLGGVGMSKTSCAARCSRGSVQGVLRAPAEGEGGVAHHENFSAAASATLERSAGTVAHGKRAARERRRRRSKVSRRRRAGRAPPARRGRRVRVPRAFKRPAKTFGGWWVVVAATPNYRKLASPDRGKYCGYRIGVSCLEDARSGASAGVPRRAWTVVGARWTAHTLATRRLGHTRGRDTLSVSADTQDG